MMRKVILVLLSVTCLSAGTASAEVPAGVTRYVPVDRAKNRTKIKEGVEEAIAQLSFLIRPFARRKLNPDRFDIAVLEFDIRKKSITIRHDGHITTTPSPGIRVPFVEDGDEMKVTQLREEKVVVQIFESSAGQLKLEYEFGADPRTVVINAQLESPKLPRTLDYSLAFVQTESSQSKVSE